MKVKVMTFNIQSTKDYVNGGFKPLLMAEAIKKIGGEIIGLNEVRGEGEDEFFTNQVETLASFLGYKYYYFGKAIDIEGRGPYGNALISKYPIVNVKKYIIEDPVIKDEDAYYETRCIIDSVIDINGEKINVLVTHVGLAKSEQKNALELINSLLDKKDGKLILMGDFNMTKDNPLIIDLGKRLFDTTLIMGDNPLTFPSINPNRKIDYIFCKDIKVLNSRVEEIVASDHFPCSMEIDV